ncbi:MAG: ABC transporter ATP-binding protein [Candidatus Brocadiia bacterium]|jgi:lipoprotein-releasing system ATP-binding protein
MSDFLAARDLVKEYVQGDEKLRVLRGVSLNVREGEFLVIVGASGAGKSTLLHLLGLLDSPTAGEVLFEGKSLTRLSGLQQARLRNTLFGFVFQFFHLLPDFNALENVMMPAYVRFRTLEWARRRRETRARAADLLARVGLKERLRHRPNQLSGGERQRVALCRALINQPRVLLLDEPTGNLDRKTGEQIHRLIHDINRAERQTVVMVTHDETAAQAAGRLIRIRDGELTA